MADTDTQQALPVLIITGAITVTAIIVFGVFVCVLPPSPPLELAQTMLVGAVALGIVGPLVGRMLRGKVDAQKPTTFREYVQRTLPALLISYAVREGGVIMAALAFHFGAALTYCAGVAAILVMSMLFDIRTPTRLKFEYGNLAGT